MLFAVDYNDNRVHIDDTYSNQEYYCPYCGAPVVSEDKMTYEEARVASKAALFVLIQKG